MAYKGMQRKIWDSDFDPADSGVSSGVVVKEVKLSKKEKVKVDRV